MRPLRAFSADLAQVLCGKFLAYRDNNIGRFEGALPRELGPLLIETPLGLKWVYELASDPAILDAVERALGPNVMVWNTTGFRNSPAMAPMFPGTRMSPTGA